MKILPLSLLLALLFSPSAFAESSLSCVQDKRQELTEQVVRERGLNANQLDALSKMSEEELDLALKLGGIDLNKAYLDCGPQKLARK